MGCFLGDVVSLLPRQEILFSALARLYKKEGMKKNLTTLGSRGRSLAKINAIFLPDKWNVMQGRLLVECDDNNVCKIMMLVIFGFLYIYPDNQKLCRVLAIMRMKKGRGVVSLYSAVEEIDNFDGLAKKSKEFVS